MTALDPCVVTLGVFDGVHRGHQALLRHARGLADERQQQMVALTFDPHPATVLRPDSVPPMLLSIDRRRELLHLHGADVVDIVTFDEPTSQMTPEDFARAYFVDRHHASAVLVGENFRFGRDASGDVARLAELGRLMGFDGLGVTLAKDDSVWSSTRARAAIAEGDIAAARRILTRDPEFEGVVVQGDRRGRLLGYPTANIDPHAGGAIPGPGVFAGLLVAGADRWPAAVSIGDNPQFGGTQMRVEAYVLDRDDLDLYGQHVRVELRSRLRDQAVFPTLEEYLDQMVIDVQTTRDAVAEGRDPDAG